MISFRAPPLCNGVTFATFQRSGKLFVDIERFSNLHNGLANAGAIILSARILVPSSPEALLQAIFPMVSMICLGVIGGMLH